MFWKTKDKPVEKSVETEKPSGWFSTDRIKPKQLKIALGNALASLMTFDEAQFTPKLADGSVATGDSIDFSNIKAAFNYSGSGVPDAQMMWYASQTFIGYQACAILAQNWLIDKGCSVPVKDAIRHGYELTINDGQEIDPATLKLMLAYDKRMNVKKALYDWGRNGRVFGIRVALFVVESTQADFYEKPFNPDAVVEGSYKGISLIDPYWCAPELSGKAASDSSAIDFYEPTWWRINGKRYHKSHLIIFRTPEPTDILKPKYLYGGIPLPQRVYERVYAAERCANEIPQLMLTKRTTALKVDIDAAMANQAEFESRMSEWAYYRDNFAVKIIGQDDDLTQSDITLTDSDDAMVTQYHLVAAEFGVPVNKLMGTTPKGFNSTGEYEERCYIEELEAIQADMLPFLERHYLLANRSYYRPVLGTDMAVVPVWNPPSAMSAKDLAEINKTKADTYKALFDAAAIDGQDIRTVLVADKHSGFNGMTEELPVEEVETDTDAGEVGGQPQGNDQGGGAIA